MGNLKRSIRIAPRRKRGYCAALQSQLQESNHRPLFIPEQDQLSDHRQTDEHEQQRPLLKNEPRNNQQQTAEQAQANICVDFDLPHSMLRILVPALYSRARNQRAKAAVQPANDEHSDILQQQSLPSDQEPTDNVVPQLGSPDKEMLRILVPSMFADVGPPLQSPDEAAVGLQLGSPDEEMLRILVPSLFAFEGEQIVADSLEPE